MIYYRCSRNKSHIFSDQPVDGFCPQCKEHQQYQAHLLRVFVTEDIWLRGFFEEKSKSLIELDKSGLKLQNVPKRLSQLSNEELSSYLSQEKRIFKELDTAMLHRLFYPTLETDTAYELRIMANRSTDQFILNPPPTNVPIPMVIEYLKIVNKRAFFANDKQINIGKNGVIAGKLQGHCTVLTPIGEQEIDATNGLMAWEMTGSYATKGGKSFPNKIYYALSSLNVIHVKKKGAYFMPLVEEEETRSIDHNSAFYKSFIPEQIKNLEFNYDMLRSKMASINGTFVLIGDQGLKVQVRKHNFEKNIDIEEIELDEIVNFSINKRKVNTPMLTHNNKPKNLAKYKGTEVELLDNGNLIRVTRGQESIQISF